jgi:hypothetical protein
MHPHPTTLEKELEKEKRLVLSAWARRGKFREFSAGMRDAM